MALTPTIISTDALPRDPQAALPVQPMTVDGADHQVNAEQPLLKRNRRAALLGAAPEAAAAVKPHQVAALLRTAIGASVH